MSKDAEVRTLWGYQEDSALQCYESARDHALDELADDPSMESITLTQYREPNLVDVPDMLRDVLELMQHVIYEDAQLCWSNGGAYLNVNLESPEAIALRAALDAYIAAHVDLSSSAWIPTGTEEVLTRADLMADMEVER